MGLVVAATLLLMAGFIYFVLVPRNPSENLVWALRGLPTVIGAFVVGGAALAKQSGRGAVFGMLAYFLVGLVGVFVAEGGSVVEFVSNVPAFLLGATMWPYAISVTLYGN